MIPDLGKYAATVLWAYGASLTLLVGLVVVSVAQGRKARKAMEQIEGKGQNNG